MGEVGVSKQSLGLNFLFSYVMNEQTRNKSEEKVRRKGVIQ